MSWRIYGYAEYGIYLLSKFQDVQFDYSKQKELFIQSLKQYITDKVSVDFDIDDKVKFKNKLFELVNKLDKGIDNYSLSCLNFETTYY
ncbi:MAG: hypothetical protein PW786_08500 [Arachidicoccus sp.]|nr:hypothetical protein [Arachidicoccus sp.]